MSIKGSKWMWWRRAYALHEGPLHAWSSKGFGNNGLPEAASAKQGSGEPGGYLRIWVEGKESAFWPPGKPKPKKPHLLNLSREREVQALLIQRIRAAAVRNG